MTTFAVALVAARKGKAPGARPYAAEAIAAVLLDRAKLAPADVETGRVIVVAADEAVREAVERLAVVTWREAIIGANYCTEPVVDKGKTVVLADEHAVEKPDPWQHLAGERGMGVLMIAAGLDAVDEGYRLCRRGPSRSTPWTPTASCRAWCNSSPGVGRPSGCRRGRTSP